MASGHVNRIKRPNTWLHRPMLQNVKKALANSEPSTHGTSRPTSQSGSIYSFGTSEQIRLQAEDKCVVTFYCGLPRLIS